MSNTIYELSDQEFINLIKSSHNIGEVLFKLKLSVVGNTWGYNLVKQRMQELNLNFSNFIGAGCMQVAYRVSGTVTNEDLFVADCKHTRNALRSRILRDSLIEYKCNICGINSWQGHPLSLELDHINGVNNDNRLENLRFLCPNCHAQTVTYGSKNAKRNLNISEEVRDRVLEAYRRLKNKDLVYKELRISRSVIKQILRDKIKEHPNQKYVIRYDTDEKEIKRYGSITELSKDLVASGEITNVGSIKAVKSRFLRHMKYHPDQLWLGSYWKSVAAEPVQ